MVRSVREASFAVEAHLILEHPRIATFLSDTDPFKERTAEAILFINYHIILPVLLSLITLGEALHAEVHQVSCIDRRKVNERQPFCGSIFRVRVPQGLIARQLSIYLRIDIVRLALFFGRLGWCVVAVVGLSIFGKLTDLGKRPALLFFRRIVPAGKCRRSL